MRKEKRERESTIQTDAISSLPLIDDWISIIEGGEDTFRKHLEHCFWEGRAVFFLVLHLHTTVRL